MRVVGVAGPIPVRQDDDPSRAKLSDEPRRALLARTCPELRELDRRCIGGGSFAHGTTSRRVKCYLTTSSAGKQLFP